MSSEQSTWPAGDAEMARRIREYDWSATPLGPIERWPERLRALVELMLESSEMASLLWGPEAIHLYNDAYAAGIGDRHPAVLGRSALATWADPEDVLTSLLERAWAGESVTVENSPAHSSPGLTGTERWFDLAYMPFRDQHGDVTGVYTTAADTTGRVHAERDLAGTKASLRQSEAILHSLYSATPQMMGVGDVENGRLVAVSANPATADFSGAPIQAIPGRLGSELESPDAIDALWLTHIQESQRTGQPVRFEYQDIRHPEQPWLAATVVVVGTSIDSRLRFSFVVEDVTERRGQEGRQAFLLTLSDALRSLSDESSILVEVPAILGRRLGVAQAYFAEIDETKGTIQAARGNLSGDSPSIACPYPVSSLSWIVPFLRNDEPIVLEDSETAPFIPDADRPAMSADGLRAMIAAPLVGRGDVLGMLVVSEPTPRSWTAAEVETVCETAERAWAAVEHARSQEALREREARFRTLFESIDEGYGLYELLFDEHQKPVDALIHEVNPAYERLMRCPSPSGKKLSEIPDGVSHEWIELMASVVDAGAPRRLERYNARLDRWFDVYVTPAPGPPEHLFVLVFTDITERKRAIEALQHSEERYRTLFDSIDQGFCTIEVLFDESGVANDYRFLEINPAFARNTGLTDAVGKRIRELAPTHESHWFDIFGRVAKSLEPLRFEAEAAALGRWYNLYVYPVGDPAEHTLAVLFEDITERRRAYAALEESESRFRTLIQNLPDYAIFLLDTQGVITEWSDGAERITGFTSGEAIGHHITLLYPDEEVAAGVPERMLAEAASTGRAEREGWLAKTGGERFWGNEITTAVHDQTGTLNGYTRISRDLTEQRRAAGELLASEERLRAILETTTDYAIFTTDAQGAIQDWFPGAEAVFGWSAAEACGQPLAITFTPEDRADGIPEHELQQAQQMGSASESRWRQHKSGSRVFLESVIRARYDLDGAFLGTLKIGRDITERRLAEQQRIDREEQVQRELRIQVGAATAELRALSRRLLVVQEEERRFLARELHDEIGQMLTGLGLTLSTETAGSEQLADARQIVAQLTEQVRQLSMDLRPAALDAYGLLPALRSHIERYEKRSGITVDLRAEGMDRRFPAPIEITAYRIVQEALTNLARHAHTNAALVQLFADTQNLTVSIRDEGAGFDPGTVREGSGLGGMRERAELLDGTLEIDAVPGGGVRVTAELPLRDDLRQRLHEPGDVEDFS